MKTIIKISLLVLFLSFITSINLNANCKIVERQFVESYEIEGVAFKIWSLSISCESEPMQEKNKNDKTHYTIVSKNGNMEYSISYDSGHTWEPYKPLHYSRTSFKVYPNPATNMIYLNLDNSQDTNYSVEIVDIHGNIIRSFDNDNSTEFDISNIEIGAYIIHLITNDGKSSSNIFIKK